MKPEKRAGRTDNQSVAILFRAFIVALLFCAGTALAQPLVPPDPDMELCTWSFDDTNWLSDLGYPPVSFTGLNNPPSFDGNALQIDTNVSAWLQYNIVETDDAATISRSRKVRLNCGFCRTGTAAQVPVNGAG